jgi:AraC-like DNA-binding protein
MTVHSNTRAQSVSFPIYAIAPTERGEARVDVPWPLALNSSAAFEGRVECIDIGIGSIAKLWCVPPIPSESVLPSLNSTSGCFYASYVHSGELSVQQGGQGVVARRGDLLLFDGGRLANVALKSHCLHIITTLTIPEPRFIALTDSGGRSVNILLLRDGLVSPFVNCLALLSEQMAACSKDELTVLYRACVALLPLALNKWSAGYGATDRRSCLLREILDHTNQNVADAELSPSRVAKQFRISVRYLHKLFAASGTTFGSYIVGARLDHICRELISPCGRNRPVAALAAAWGFRDISTFNRAFKKRFGCTPRGFRVASALDGSRVPVRA